MSPTPERTNHTIGACGLDCGLCPRYYTTGSSRCLGCGGPNFFSKHPACGILSCSVLKHDCEVCSLCADFPCPKIQKNLTTTRDSFITYQKVGENLKLVKDHGLRHFLTAQEPRMVWLTRVLSEFDDGRSKNLLCISATLLPISFLNEALQNAIKKVSEANLPLEDKKTRTQILTSELTLMGEKSNVKLRLRK